MQVPGFYDGVREGMLDAAVSRLDASDEFQLPAYQDSLGVPSFVSNTSQRCVCVWMLVFHAFQTLKLA